jgi:hypothetical protein
MEREGGGNSEGKSETEDSTKELRGSLGRVVGGTKLEEVIAVNLLDADCFPRKDIFSLDILGP